MAGSVNPSKSRSKDQQASSGLLHRKKLEGLKVVVSVVSVCLQLCGLTTARCN